MASAAIPLLFPPVAMEGGYYGDGALRQTTPLAPAIHLGADRILVIGVRHPASGRVTLVAAPNMAEQFGFMLDSLFVEGLQADLERLNRINALLVGRLPGPAPLRHAARRHAAAAARARPDRGRGRALRRNAGRAPDAAARARRARRARRPPAVLSAVRGRLHARVDRCRRARRRPGVAPRSRPSSASIAPTARASTDGRYCGSALWRTRSCGYRVRKCRARRSTR